MMQVRVTAAAGEDSAAGKSREEDRKGDGAEAAGEGEGAGAWEGQSYYDSIAQAAAAMGTTVARLRWAKKKGAPGFRGSRVYPGELSPWLREQETAGGQTAEGAPIDKEGWEIRRLRLQCEGLELANKKAAEESWDANVVRTSWLLHMRGARQVLLQMATDLAPRIAGRPALECEGLLKVAAQDALAKLRGNPYGAQGVPCCAHCGEELEVLLEEKKVGEGKEVFGEDAEHGTRDARATHGENFKGNEGNGSTGEKDRSEVGAVETVAGESACAAPAEAESAEREDLAGRASEERSGRRTSGKKGAREKGLGSAAVAAGGGVAKSPGGGGKEDRVQGEPNGL